MSEFLIYGDSSSGNCLKALWIARHLDIAHRWIETSVAGSETRTEAFLRLYPWGQVPLLVPPDGRTLAQSNAILLYLAEIHDSPLVPCEPFARAKVYEWLFWEQYSHEPFIAVRRFQKKTLGKSDEEIDPRLLPKGEAALRRMQAELSKSTFIAGPRLTIADIALVAYTRVAHEGGFDVTSLPDVTRWIERVEHELQIA